MDNVIFNNFSRQFWETIEKSQNLLSHLPKKISITFSFSQEAGSQVTSILPDICEMENILMRLRIFRLNNGTMSVKRLLNKIGEEHIETRGHVGQIRENIRTLETWEMSLGIKVNGNEYKKIQDVVDYILHGSLLHDDEEKKSHYDALFQDNPFMRDCLYSNILDWILAYIRYILFELDLILQNTIFQKPITREEHFEKLKQFIKYIDTI